MKTKITLDLGLIVLFGWLGVLYYNHAVELWTLLLMIVVLLLQNKFTATYKFTRKDKNELER